jgi:hypothetical protein
MTEINALAFITHGRVTRPNELGTVRISNNYSAFYDTLYSAVLRYYAASSGNSLPTFRDNLSVPSSGPIGCPDTSVKNYHYSLHNSPEERSSHILSGGRFKLLYTGVQHMYVRFYTGVQYVHVRSYTGVQHVHVRSYTGVQHVHVRFYTEVQHVHVRFYKVCNTCMLDSIQVGNTCMSDSIHVCNTCKLNSIQVYNIFQILYRLATRVN